MNIYIDSSHHITELCKLGGVNNTDKSPLAMNSVCAKHRKGYTAVYSVLLSQFRNKEITFAEIGIEAGASLKMWRSYFSKAKLYAFEYVDKKIENCKAFDLSDVYFNKIDVSDPSSIDNAFESTGIKYDVIIDDSTHLIDHQNNIINIAHKYLNPGGILIIEDINRPTDISVFKIGSEWGFFTFLTCHHSNRKCWDNDKLLYLVKH